jgi:hypothetical protein
LVKLGLVRGEGERVTERKKDRERDRDRKCVCVKERETFGTVRKHILEEGAGRENRDRSRER